ncbi:MAG: PilT/PilU family type 4a pilus ATPase, partial [Planctomycetota bacterium]
MRTNRRRGERVVAALEFTVQGVTESFAGQTVNVSRTGALLWITDERFLTGSDAINMVRFSERVAQELGDGMRLEFEGGVVCSGEVVRVSRKGYDDKSPMLVACRFTEPLSDTDWKTLGLPASAAPEPPAPAKPPPDAPPLDAQLGPDIPPPGMAERRAIPRVHKVVAIEVTGDYGCYKAYALNLSPRGVLLTITDPEFETPNEPDQLLLFTQRLGFQFRNGMVIRFLESGVVAEADVIHVTERAEGKDLLVVVGVQFRRALSQPEFRRLEFDAVDEPPAREPRRSRRAKRSEKAAPPVPPATPSQRVRIYDLLHAAVDAGASDLHLKVGSPPRLRVLGHLKDVNGTALGQEETRAMAAELMSSAMARRLEDDGDVELACTLDGVARFRVSIFRQRGQTGLAIRCIPVDVPTIESLGISPVARALAERPRGLVLVTGPTGSGKSHTLAAMVSHINQTRDCHILTMEDPIEFLHADDKAHITQREMGRDAPNFASALRRALRQDPDVILVGEMRDLETISLALTAAETGHLVFATLHTASATQSPERIVDVFPPSQQAQIRLQLSESLQGVMAQILVPTLNKKLQAVQEILIANEAVRSIIREAKTPQLYNVVQTGASEGMKTLEAALDDLVKKKVI